MSRVRVVADANFSASISSTLIVRRLRSTALHVGKVLIHAVRADAMAEVQCAVLQQELLDWLPETFPVTDGFAVAAGGNQSLGVMHLAELIHQGQGSASEFQQGCGLLRQAFHHLVLRIGE